MNTWLIVVIGLAAYLGIGLVAAFIMAWIDILHDCYDTQDGYIGYILGWPMLIALLIILIPFTLFDSMMNAINDAVQTLRKD